VLVWQLCAAPALRDSEAASLSITGWHQPALPLCLLRHLSSAYVGRRCARRELWQQAQPGGEDTAVGAYSCTSGIQHSIQRARHQATQVCSGGVLSGVLCCHMYIFTASTQTQRLLAAYQQSRGALHMAITKGRRAETVACDGMHH
jgi:hypothetical protein